MEEKTEMEQEKKTAMEGEEFGDFSSLPEGVIANILSLTTPSDACRSSAVSRAFHAAAQSDIVWHRFLPADWETLIRRIKPGDLDFDPASCSRHDIFFALVDNAVLIDDGRKSLSLDIWTGKKCIMLGAREISFGRRVDDSIYCTWESHHRSRFPEVVVFNEARGFEMRAKISCRKLSPATTYTAHFVFGRNVNILDSILVAPVILGIICGERTKSIWLDPYFDKAQWTHPCIPRVGRNMIGNMLESEQPRMRPDGWSEIELGEFQTDGEDEEEVEVARMEITGSGIVVEGIEMRPKGLKLA